MTPAIASQVLRAVSCEIVFIDLFNIGEGS
jgi:hypothetical protein